MMSMRVMLEPHKVVRCIFVGIKVLEVDLRGYKGIKGTLGAVTGTGEW